MSSSDRTITLEAFLLAQTAVGGGIGMLMLAKEAIASTALAHPEWPPLGEKRTWAEWLRWERERKRDG